jgi:hypothetical protein
MLRTSEDGREDIEQPLLLEAGGVVLVPEPAPLVPDAEPDVEAPEIVDPLVASDPVAAPLTTLPDEVPLVATAPVALDPLAGLEPVDPSVPEPAPLDEPEDAPDDAPEAEPLDTLASCPPSCTTTLWPWIERFAQ